MKGSLLLALALLLSIYVQAQHFYFPTSGTITYESKFHLHNYLKRNYLNKPNLNTWEKAMIDHIMKNGAPEMIIKHTLKFYDQETLFEMVKEEYPTNYSSGFNYFPLLQESKTYSNFVNSSFSKLITYGGEEILLADTIPSVKWRYTDEYRNIAGYECRRANGVVQDSIYVVAFFTSQIPIPAGPELVQGLPGTILGLSIPEKNINMFATSVQMTNDVVSSTLTKKKKVVPQNKVEVAKLLKSTIGRWDNDNEFKKYLSRVFF